MRPIALLLPLVLAGCAAPPAAQPSGAPGLLPEGPAFLPPVTLTTEGPGFEPSIDVGPDGTIYAAAAKTGRPNAGTRLASWLWYSADGGATFQDLPSPGGVHRLMFGFEGDTAVDAGGRFYFADTYLPDNAIHRWSLGPAGPAWDFSRPVQGTSAAMDDRPWLSAQGEGVVYLLSNNGQRIASLGGLLRGDATAARIHAFVSQDGGLTWSLGHAFPSSRFCQVAASPADDMTAFVACDEAEGAGAPLRVWRSPDRGATWTEVHTTTHRIGTGYLAPAIAVTGSGRPLLAFLDERVDWSGVQNARWNGEVPGRIRVAAPDAAGAWAEQDATPFPGRFGMIHAAAAGPGVAAITFYATRDLLVGDATEWHAYALVTREADAPSPAWSLSRLLDAPAAVGPMPPRDLFQGAVGPDGSVHVVVQKNRDEPRQPGDGIRADVLYVRSAPPG